MVVGDEFHDWITIYLQAISADNITQQLMVQLSRKTRTLQQLIHIVQFGNISLVTKPSAKL